MSLCFGNISESCHEDEWRSDNRSSHIDNCVSSVIFRSLCLQSTRLEGEVVFAMNKYGKKEGIVTLILNIGAGRESVDTFTLYTNTLITLFVPTYSVWYVILFRETDVVHRITHSLSYFLSLFTSFILDTKKRRAV